MPLFTAIGTAVAVGIGLTAGTTAFALTAGAVAFGTQLAVGYGANMLMQNLAGREVTPTESGPGFNVSGQLASGADFPRSFPLGWRATAGSLVYANTWRPGPNKTPNMFLTQVIALSDLPVKRVVPDGETTAHIYGLAGFWVNGTKVTIDYDNHEQKGYPILEYFAKDPVEEDGSGGGQRDNLWIEFFDGTQTTVPSWMVDDVGSNERPYDANRVGKGIAYAIVTARVHERLWQGFPEYKFELHGIPLYDPSKDSTVGGVGSHRWNDKSTWGGDGDDYPIVQAYNVLRGITYNGTWMYGLQSSNAARFPIAHWIEQIEKCRDAVNKPGGGTEPRYRTSLELFVNNELGTTIETLLTGCQGRMSESGGFYKPFIGGPEAAVDTFTDDDIVATQERSFVPFFGLSDSVTGITAQFPSPDEGWVTKAAPPLYDEDLEDAAGGRRMLSDVNFNMVPYERQVQQLMKESLQEAQRAKRHTITLPPRFTRAEPGDTLQWTSPINGYTNKLFRIDGAIDHQNLNLTVDLTEVSADDFNWDTATDFVPTVAGSTAIVPIEAQAIVDFNAVANELEGDVPGVKRPGILLSWDTEDLADISGVQFEVRKASDETVVITGRSDRPYLGLCQISENGLLPNTAYEVRARFLTVSNNRPVEWSGWIAVTTPDTRTNLEELADYLQAYMTTELAAVHASLDQTIQRVAAIAADQDAQNFLEKATSKRVLQVVNENLSASITEAMDVAITTAGEALAAYALTVAATYASIGEIDAAVDASVGAAMTAFAGAYETLAEYDLDVQATYATQGALTSAIAGVNSTITTFASGYASLAAYKTAVEATYASTYLSQASASSTYLAQATAASTYVTITNAAAIYLTQANASSTYLSISTAASLYATAGSVAAMYALTLDVNGYISGFESINNGATSSFTILADNFRIAKPGVTGGTATTLFEVGTNFDGFPAIILKNGHLSVDTIAAVTANITNLNATNINSYYAIYNNLGYNTVAYNDETEKNVPANTSNGGNDTVTTTILFSKAFIAPLTILRLEATAVALMTVSGLVNGGGGLTARLEVLQDGTLIKSWDFGYTGYSAGTSGSIQLDSTITKNIVVNPGSTITMRMRLITHRRWGSNNTSTSAKAKYRTTVKIGEMTTLALFPNGVA